MDPRSHVTLPPASQLSRRAALQLSAGALASVCLSGCRRRADDPLAYSGPRLDVAQVLHDMLVRLLAGARFTQNGVIFVRISAADGYNGFWPDDSVWPFLAAPELAREFDFAPLLAWLTEAVVDLKTVPDRVEFSGLAVLSPNAADQAPASVRMPLHLPSAWTRFLAVMEHLGYTVPQKDRWAALIERSFAQVPLSFGLVYADPQANRVGFGFHDTVHMGGLEAMTSLITWRGLERAADLFATSIPATTTAEWRRKAAGIRANLGRIWDDTAGGLLGASFSGRQVSVWATGLAYPLLSSAQQARASAFFLREREHIFRRGCTRQVAQPEGWANASGGKYEYQRGGFWATGTGFVLPALMAATPRLGDAVAQQLAHELSAFDCAEWLDAHAEPHGARRFLGSVAMPLLAMRCMRDNKPLLELL